MVRLRIREVAEARGFTISGLSRRSDVSLRTIRRLWKDPEAIATTDTLGKIATALEVPVSELLEDVPDES